LSHENINQLRQEFIDYLSNDVTIFSTMEKSAEEKIKEIIFSPSESSWQKNYIDFFKCLIKYMKNGTRVRPDDRVFMASKNGHYVYYPVGITDQGNNYGSNLLFALYFYVREPGLFTIYDFEYRQ